MSRSKKRDEWLAPMHGEVGRQKRRAGVMPTRKEVDQRKRPPRHKREAPDCLFEISQR